MKPLVYLFLLFSISVCAQSRYLTKTGLVSFEASVPSFEEVEAANNSTTAIINSETGEIAVLVLVKGFRFKNALMEEHFNENYADSDQFPKAIFKGKIHDFSLNKLSSSKVKFKLNGELSFHGKTKTLKDITIDITTNETGIVISGEFIASASDYNIKVPRIVRDKISEIIKVTFHFQLSKK